jgi:4-carboxymuconolactone decarboxylase
MSPEMEVAYNFIDELLTTHQVTDATFQAAKDKYGEKGIVDMIGLSGWYGLVSMALDVDRYPMPAGVQPELKPLENPLPVVGMGFATPIPGTPSPATATSMVNGKALNLKGDRFKPLKYDEMTPAQKKMTDIAMVARGPGGSFNITLRSPEAGEILYAVGDKVRFHMSPPAKLVEMSIMLMGRFWGTQMEWAAHSRAAVQAGLSADAAKAIGEGRRPEGLKPDEQAVYNFFSELFKTKQVSDATFAAVKNLVGERGLVDLMVSAGYYEFTCMFMNVDRIPLGPNQQPELKYLAKPIP